MEATIDPSPPVFLREVEAPKDLSTPVLSSGCEGGPLPCAVGSWRPSSALGLDLLLFL